MKSLRYFCPCSAYSALSVTANAPCRQPCTVDLVQFSRRHAGLKRKLEVYAPATNATMVKAKGVLSPGRRRHRRRAHMVESCFDVVFGACETEMSLFAARVYPAETVAGRTVPLQIPAAGYERSGGLEIG